MDTSAGTFLSSAAGAPGSPPARVDALRSEEGQLALPIEPSEEIAVFVNQ
jgi:hypothetical protein